MFTPAFGVFQNKTEILNRGMTYFSFPIFFYFDRAVGWECLTAVHDV
jgi:hypothetical protein